MSHNLDTQKSFKMLKMFKNAKIQKIFPNTGSETLITKEEWREGIIENKRASYSKYLL